jgi:DNA-binding NarL/FixJ family response regulator
MTTALARSAVPAGLSLLLAHPHRLLRGSFRPLLSELGSGVAAHEAGTFGELISIMDQTEDIDLLLLDGGLPGMNGLASLRAIRHRFPSVRIMLLVGQADPAVIFEALRAGAQGVVVQNISADAMVGALRLLLAGERYLPSETITALLEMEARTDNQDALSAHFSQSETAVIPLLLDGLCNKTIAFRLGIEEPAVKARLRRIYRKIGVANRAQAVMRLLVRGQGDPAIEAIEG